MTDKLPEQVGPYKDDLTAKQGDKALFLPALSGFYSSYIGKQRHEQHVDAARIPKRFENGIEGMNFLNEEEAYFKYKWALYSAGHANLDTTKFDASEDMIRNRSKNSFVLGDSGGFQIGKGVWEGDWRANSGCQLAHKKRTQVLDWMESYMNYGMGLDIPGWVGRTPKGREATKIEDSAQALEASKFNFEYWIKNRRGNCKFLTVLQGEDHLEADQWYDAVKKYSDPKHFPNEHFNGWAMGSQNKCDVQLILKRLVALIYDGLLESGKQDWIHYLGTSKLEWAVMFTDIQRAIRKYHNPTLSISFDCASPFLATANGQVYWDNRLEYDDKWSYRMMKCVDDKKYAKDTRMFRDVVVNDGYFPTFIDSPIISRMEINDVCHYGPGDLNKIGKEGRTSWDSFAYALLMGHNVYAHIKSVQDANERYDQGIVPEMLIHKMKMSNAFGQLVDAIFSAKSRGAAEKLIAEEKHWFSDIIGSSANGLLGKKAENGGTMARELAGVLPIAKEKVVKVKYKAVYMSNAFEGDGVVDFIPPPADDSGLDEDTLDKLEAADEL
jgi:hypothetical protein